MPDIKTEIKIYPSNNYPQVFYLFDLLLKLLLPVCFITWEHIKSLTEINPELIAKWFIFWGMGIYFFVTGVAQLVKPVFAARLLYLVKTPKHNELVVQLGIINISIGVLAILSLSDTHALKMAAAVAVAYFGLTTFRNFLRKKDLRFEPFRLITDLILFSTSLLFMFFFLFAESHG